MSPEIKQALHRELARLRHEVALGIQPKRNGICHSTFYNSFGNRTIDLSGAIWDLGDLCRKWPKATDFDGFPVPCPGYTNSAEGYHATEDKWAGEYGALRRELLDFLIERTAP